MGCDRTTNDQIISIRREAMIHIVRKHVLPVALLLLSAYVVYSSWFHDTGMLTHGDWYTLEKDGIAELVSWPTLWTSNVNFGSTVLVMSFYPILLIIGLLGRLGLDFSVISRLVFMIPIILFSLIGMYAYSFSLFKSRPAAMISSLVFFFNTYFVLGRTGHLTLMAAFSLFPLSMLAYAQLIDTFTTKKLILTSLLLGFMSFFEFRVFYLFGLMILGYGIFVPSGSLTLAKATLKTNLLRLSPLLVAVGIHTPWLYAFSRMGPGLDSQFFHRILFGNSFMSLERAITLFHPFWTGKGLATFTVQEIPFYFWAVPLLAFYGLYVGRKNKIVLWYGLLACVGILLSKQVDVPFHKMYEWLFEEFPGFVAFREASKFYGIIAFAYAILIGSAIEKVWRLTRASRFHLALSVFAFMCTGLVGGLFLYNAIPILRGDIKELIVATDRPADYQSLNTRLGADDEFYRTLWVPTWSRWSYYTEIHPRVNYQDLTSEYLTVFKKGASPSATLSLSDVWEQPLSNQFFDMLSVRYVIVPEKDNLDDFFTYYGERDSFVSALQKAPFLKEVEGVFSNMSVFENDNHRPHVYTSSSEDELTSPAEITRVHFERINPTRYEVKLDQLKGKTYLYFTDAYHSDWILSGMQTWFDLFPQPLQSVKHKATETRTNVYVIDPDKLVSELPSHAYSMNPDGSVTVKLLLSFTPQYHLYIWAFLLLGITGVGSLLWIRKNKHGN